MPSQFTITARNEKGVITFPAAAIRTRVHPGAVLAKLQDFESVGMRVTIEKDGEPCTLSDLEDAVEAEANA